MILPLADYTCPCSPGIVYEDIPFASALGAARSAPICQICECLMEVIPQANFDLKTDGEGGQGFQKFTVHRQVPTKDGLVQREEQIDSIHKLRQIEKDSEQRYRNGEGEPLRFRAYAQDRSNRDRSSFGASGTIGGRSYDSGIAPSGKQRAQLGVARHGTRKPKVQVARGAGESPVGGL